MNRFPGRFGECNYNDERAMYQPGDFIDAEVLDDELWVNVDFYGQRYSPDSGVEFDVEQWEREQFRLMAPPSRENWRDLFRVARALLAGRTVVLAEGRFDRETWLAAQGMAQD